MVYTMSRDSSVFTFVARYMDRRGVEVGNTDIVVYACPIVGRRSVLPKIHSIYLIIYIKMHIKYINY